ncbi:hypothetical protein ACJQWK_04297 [Exserohilum turcicum]
MRLQVHKISFPRTANYEYGMEREDDTREAFRLSKAMSLDIPRESKTEASATRRILSSGRLSTHTSVTAYEKGDEGTAASAASTPADKPTFLQSLIRKLQPKTPQPSPITEKSSPSLYSRKTTRIFALPQAWKTTLFRTSPTPILTPSEPSTMAPVPKRNPIPAHWRIEPLASERSLLLSERQKRASRRDSVASLGGERSDLEDEEAFLRWMALEEWRVQHKILVEDYESLTGQGVDAVSVL